ncbi:polyamine oxidase (exo-N4-amino) 1 isoform X2 [Brachyhypopomus gauderio]|uniref:polyamine oxidase (exo-N4-amino) 1 isoform X2 n=1 Tax=Brachyhypopomus gauderio TaxID=698409 RepID=UPI00404223EE
MSVVVGKEDAVLQQPRIVVIGAGVAGLCAATKLRELGFTQLVLIEASGTAGGRIAKTNIGKGWVDTGAQYIHGASTENPVYRLFKKSALLSQVSEEGKSMFYRHSGRKVNEDLAERVNEAAERITRLRSSNSGRSFGEHFAEQAYSVSESWQDEEKKDVQSVLALFGKELLLDTGATDLHKVSLDSWQYYINMGDDLNVEGLMFQIVEDLVEELPKEQLVLNKAVSKIEWDGAFSGAEGQGFPVRVLCEDGEVLLADHVIITISLGCLKDQAATFFNPSLSLEKMEAINKLRFGNIAKIFLEYDQAFWDSDVSRISLIWDDDSVASISTSTAEWLRHLQLFTVMRPKEKFGNVLIGWCPGHVADLVETLTEEELSTAITQHLRLFTGNPAIPLPRTVHCTQWSANNFVRGSYTFLPVGVDGNVMDVLAQPLLGTKNPSKVEGASLHIY